MASRDRDKPAAELLRRSLAPPPGKVNDCPDPEILAAYFERSLDGNELARHELHLSECSRCREQLTAMVRADESAADGRERTSGWSWLWGWRRLAPAFAVLVIAASIWYIQRPAHLAHSLSAQRNEQQPLVAMSPPTENPIAAAPQESKPDNNAVAHIAPAPPEPALQQKTRKAENSADLAEGRAGVGGQANASRDSAQIDSFAKTPSVSEPAAPTAGALSAASAGPSTSLSQSVEVPPAPLPEAPAARTRAARQLEATNETGNPASNTAVRGTISGAFSAGAGAAENKQTTARAVPSSATARDQAVTVEATDETATQKMIRTPNPQIQWRIAGAGFVERTTDGGAVWQGQLPNPDAQLLAGSAPTSQICWLVGHNGIILVTTNGATWKTIPPPARADFVDVIAKDASSATVTAADSRKFTTTDGGKHWNSAP